MPEFQHDGLTFNYLDLGSGFPFFFQHGLGGDVSQTSGIFKPPAGVRLVTFDCRAHGRTVPLGDPQNISLSQFADDLATLMDHLSVDQAVVGGISMGAAISANFALRFHSRLRGLILSRPAWLEGPVPENLALFGKIAGLIREHGRRRGKEIFIQSPEYARIKAESVDSAESLSGQFDHPRADETVVKLERIPQDRPYAKLADLQQIHAPALILANRQDPIHPFEYGEALAKIIPGAIFRELTPKCVDKDRHAADVQRYVEEFLRNLSEKA